MTYLARVICLNEYEMAIFRTSFGWELRMSPFLWQPENNRIGKGCQMSQPLRILHLILQKNEKLTSSQKNGTKMALMRSVFASSMTLTQNTMSFYLL